MGEKKELSMEELKGIIGTMIATETKAGIEGLKKEILEVNRKALFSGEEGKEWETGTKSIIDTSFFRKDYGIVTGDPMRDGEKMARRLATAGGPFLKLSPVMEKFAQVMRFGADPNKLGVNGVNVREYNAEVKESNAKLLGETKDTATGLTTTDAGALVPVEYLATVVEFATAQSRLIPLLWRIPMGTLSMKIPKLTQAAGSYFGGVTLYHPDEAASKTESKPSFETLTFTAKKTIGIIPLSDEVVMDSSINLVNYVTGLFVRAFQYQIENEVINGTGANGQMLGIVNDPSINTVGRQTLGSVCHEDCVNLESAIDENFANLTFLTRRATFNQLRLEKDSNQRPLYQEPFAVMYGQRPPDQLIGYPVIKTRNVPLLGTTGDLTLGDMGYYIWALRQDMVIDMSKDVRFFYDQTVVRFVMRMDGAPGVSIAYAVLTSTPAS